ncbi:Nuclear pore complex protein Nup85 [Aphelenchoides fujianensis]|nr:Nuclear pore complex protein Nup85 [Aphelenchoides fujianensis]
MDGRAENKSRRRRHARPGRRNRAQQLQEENQQVQSSASMEDEGQEDEDGEESRESAPKRRTSLPGRCIGPVVVVSDDLLRTDGGGKAHFRKATSTVSNPAASTGEKPRFFRNAANNTTFFDSPVTKKVDLRSARDLLQRSGVGTSEQRDPPDGRCADHQPALPSGHPVGVRDAEGGRRAEGPHAPPRALQRGRSLWSLTEAVYIQSTENPLVVDLINWGLYCFGNTAKTISNQVLEKAESPETHEYYWNALVLSIVHVDLNSAIRFLRKHTRFEKDGALQQMCTFLQSFQFALDAGITDPTDFIDTQKKVRDALRTGVFKKSEQLEMIGGLLIGRMESFEKCGRSLNDFWYELLPAYVLFSCPGADLENVGKVAQTLYNQLCPSQSSLSPKLDASVILTLSELIQAAKAPKNRIHFGESGSDENRRPAKRPAVETAEDVRTLMILDYGTALLESHDFWNIANSYILACGAENATDELDGCLLRLELDSVKKAEQIYALALKHELPLTKAAVARSLVEKTGTYNEALSWALRSELPDLINLVSNKMLSTFNAEAISQLRIFDAASAAFLNYPNLLLLQRFYQFRRFLVQGQASEAAGKLYELVTCGMAPIAFQIAINNFELQNAIIHPPKAADNPQMGELKTKVKLLRQALCGALALRSLS